MIHIRKSKDRGHFDHGWLKTWHSFSFGNYYDPAHVHFRALRVLNDDIIAPGGGFGRHPHDNMEIVTYPISGALAHEDSTGTRSELMAGQVQRMSAGSGIAHSEFNASDSCPLRLLQIWFFPAEKNIDPSYEEGDFPRDEKLNRLRLIVSPTGENGSLRIHQDLSIHASMLEPGNTAGLELAPGRHAWVQVARGAVELNGVRLEEGDGAALSDETMLDFAAIEDEAEFLVFDLA